MAVFHHVILYLLCICLKMKPQPKKKVPIISRYPPWIMFITLRPSLVFHAANAKAAMHIAKGMAKLRQLVFPAFEAAKSNALKSRR